MSVYADFLLEGATHEHGTSSSFNEEDENKINLNELNLIDNNGFYLHHPDQEKEWGFVEGKNETILKDFPNVSRTILSEESGQFFDKNSNTYFTFFRVRPYSEKVKAIHTGEHKHDLYEAEEYTMKNSNDIYWVQILFTEKLDITEKVNILFFKTISLILLVLMFFVVSMVAFLQRIIIEPVKKIIHGADRIKKGNLDYQLSLGKRKDEFGDLANEFNSMSAVLKRYKETMEQKILERTDDLKKFKDVVEDTRECVIISNSAGVVLYANNSLERITGYSKNEIVNKENGIKELWGGAMPADFNKQVLNTVQTNKKTFLGKIKNKTRQGNEYTALLSITPMLDKKGEIMHFVSILSDLSGLDL